MWPFLSLFHNFSAEESVFSAGTVPCDPCRLVGQRVGGTSCPPSGPESQSLPWQQGGRWWWQCWGYWWENGGQIPNWSTSLDENMDTPAQDELHCVLHYRQQSMTMTCTRSTHPSSRISLQASARTHSLSLSLSRESGWRRERGEPWWHVWPHGKTTI